MKKILKILSLIGFVVAGIAIAHHLIQSSTFSKPIVSVPLELETSDLTAYLPTKSVKVSKLDKIQENYQPKAFEEIPVEYERIATSDIDEGRKISTSSELDNASKQSTTAADKLVKVEQGSIYPFSSSKSVEQQVVPMQADMSQAVIPFEGNNYYPGASDYNMGYSPRSNTCSDNDIHYPNNINYASQPVQSQHPVYQDQEQKKSYFRRLPDDISSSNNIEYNPEVMPSKKIDQNIPQQQEDIQAGQEIQNPEQKSSSWKDYLKKGLLGVGLASAGAYAGKKLYDWFMQPKPGQSIDNTMKLTQNISDAVCAEQGSANSGMVKGVLAAAGIGAAIIGAKKAYEYVKNNFASNTETPQANAEPDVQNRVSAASGQSRTGLFSATPVHRMLQRASPAPMIDNAPADLGTQRMIDSAADNQVISENSLSNGSSEASSQSYLSKIGNYVGNAALRIGKSVGIDLLTRAATNYFFGSDQAVDLAGAAVSMGNGVADATVSAVADQVIDTGISATIQNSIAETAVSVISSDFVEQVIPQEAAAPSGMISSLAGLGAGLAASWASAGIVAKIGATAAAGVTALGAGTLIAPAAGLCAALAVKSLIAKGASMATSNLVSRVTPL